VAAVFISPKIYERRRSFLKHGSLEKSPIIATYKNDELCCDNYRWSSSLRHCEKITANVPLQRIRKKNQ